MTDQTNPDIPTSVQLSPNTDGDGGEIRLLDLLVVLAKHKNLVIGLPAVVAVLAVVYALLLPNIYTATTKILPPQQNQASSVLAAQLGGLASLAGGIAGIRSSNDVYIAMLKSRTVADNMIERFGIMKRLDLQFKYQTQARKWLEGNARIATGKDGLIVIEVDDQDPKRAAEYANAYVDELFKLTKVLAVTETSQRRLFFERQFAQAKDNLVKAEAAARQALEQGGLVKVDEQGRAMVENTARLRAQMSVKEVQIGAMRTFATERNPELQRAQQELESLRRELAKIEGSGGTKNSTTSGPGNGADSLRLLRDVKYYEVVYDLLAKQYELAKIDEAKDSAVIQVMDKAIEPDLKSKPLRRNIVLSSTAVAFLLAILLAFVREAMVKTNTDPQQVQRLQAIRNYLTWRRTA